jgi:hypothetical protein
LTKTEIVEGQIQVNVDTLLSHHKVKVKLSVFNKVPHHGDLWGECKVYLHTILMLAVDGGEWSALYPSCFNPRGESPPLPTGLEAGLEAIAER